MFAFKLWYVSRSNDSYYVTRWDLAKSITVVAETKAQAIDKAEAALGDAGNYRRWVYQVDSIRDVLAPEEA